MRETSIKMSFFLYNSFLVTFLANCLNFTTINHFQLSSNLQLIPQLLSDNHERRLNRLFKEMRNLDPTFLFQEKIGVGRKDMPGYSEISLFNAMKGIISDQKLQNNIERILLGINKNSTTHQLSRCARELIDILNKDITIRRCSDLKSTT